VRPPCDTEETFQGGLISRPGNSGGSGVRRRVGGGRWLTDRDGESR
jgi:hypothetical protein